MEAVTKEFQASSSPTIQPTHHPENRTQVQSFTFAISGNGIFFGIIGGGYKFKRLHFVGDPPLFTEQRMFV